MLQFLAHIQPHTPTIGCDIGRGKALVAIIAALGLSCWLLAVGSWSQQRRANSQQPTGLLATGSSAFGQASARSQARSPDLQAELTDCQQQLAAARALASQKIHALAEAQRPIDIMINESTSDAVKRSVYPEVGARDVIMINPRADNGILTQDGQLSIDGLRKWVLQNVPAEYKDALPIDIEGSAVEAYGLTAVQTVLALRPNAGVGIFGRPDILIYGSPEDAFDLKQVEARTDKSIKANAALIEASTMLFPQAYDGLPNDIMKDPPYLGHEARAVRASLNRILEVDKPVAVFIMVRHFDDGAYTWYPATEKQRNALGGLIVNPWGGTLLSSTEFVDNLRAIRDAASSSGTRVKAVVLWGADGYFLNGATQERAPSLREFAHRWRSIVAAEYPDGYALAKTDPVHEHYLRLMGEVLHDVPYNPRTPRATGPLQTPPPPSAANPAPPPAPLPPPAPVVADYGQFEIPDTYVLDSGNVQFTAGPDFPADGWITFQTWSDTAKNLIALGNTYMPPWVYPDTLLHDVPVGTATLQALIHKQDGSRAGLVEKRITVMAAGATRPPTPPSRDGKLTPSGPIKLNAGSTTIENRAIGGSSTGIVGENDIRIGTLTLRNTTVRTNPGGPPTGGVGLYIGGGCDRLILDHVQFDIAENVNDFCYRGNAAWLESNDSVYKNTGHKPCFRAYGLTRGQSERDTFIGGEMLLGGGPTSQWQNPLPFANFTFRDGAITVNSVEIFDQTHHVTFENMEFEGTDHISIQNGAHDITFTNCKNVPEVRFYDASGKRFTPSDSQLEQRKIRLPS